MQGQWSLSLCLSGCCCLLFGLNGDKRLIEVMMKMSHSQSLFRGILCVAKYLFLCTLLLVVLQLVYFVFMNIYEATKTQFILIVKYFLIV